MKVCQLGLRMSRCIVLPLFAVLLISRQGFSQAAFSSSNAPADSMHAETAVATELPDAPLPQVAVGESSSQAEQSPQKPDDAQPATKSRQQTADEQLQAEKKQRVFGLIPSFNTSYNNDAVSLTGKQKF